MKTSLDKAGRIVMPKRLRDELGLEPGDDLEIEISGGDLVLRSVRPTARLRKKRGVWVCRIGERLCAATVRSTNRQIERERDARNLSKALTKS